MAEIKTQDLPALPEPEDLDGARWGYTRDQMEAYAIDALAAAESLRTTSQPDHFPDAGQMIATSQPVGVPEAAVHKNHLFDLRYTLDVLHKVRCLISDRDQAHGELGAAITSMRYVIERTEAMASPSSIPPHVMEILRSIHRRPSDCGIWLDDITMILRDVTASPTPPAAQALEIDQPTEDALFAEWLDAAALAVDAEGFITNAPTEEDVRQLIRVAHERACASLSAAPTAAGGEAKPDEVIAKQAARWQWVAQFLSVGDVGDEQSVWALVVDHERMELAAERARCFTSYERFDDDTDTSIEAIVDAAIAAQSAEAGKVGG